MDRLTAFGLFAVTAMVVCYAFEKRSHWFILGFAGACALGSVQENFAKRQARSRPAFRVLLSFHYPLEVEGGRPCRQ